MAAAAALPGVRRAAAAGARVRVALGRLRGAAVDKVLPLPGVPSGATTLRPRSCLRGLWAAVVSHRGRRVTRMVICYRRMLGAFILHTGIGGCLLHLGVMGRAAAGRQCP